MSKQAKKGFPDNPYDVLLDNPADDIVMEPCPTLKDSKNVLDGLLMASEQKLNNNIPAGKRDLVIFDDFGSELKKNTWLEARAMEWRHAAQ